MKKPPKSKELRLEDILFNCRDLLRGKASVADKRDLMLTLVFLRFIGEKFTLRREEIREELLAKKGIYHDLVMAQRSMSRIGGEKKNAT